MTHHFSFKHRLTGILLLSLVFGCSEQVAPANTTPMTPDTPTIRIATFNVSMEANNYRAQDIVPSATTLLTLLNDPEQPQIRNIAEIIQRVAPDILLLNEFDFSTGADPSAAQRFINHFLAVSQQGQTPQHYDYVYTAPVNTGEPSPFDLDRDGEATGTGGDAYGYGIYPGQYGMVLLSKYPIDFESVRTFQMFLWQDMPNAQQPVYPGTTDSWYDEAAWQGMRLSSKSHWDIPVNVEGKWLHVLAMHPTPPNFDGPEDRNGKRNHDEIRLMADYLSSDTSGYIYDDQGNRGGLSLDSRFVLVGDFNAADAGDKYRPGVIEQLLQHPAVNGDVVPESDGGKAHCNDAYCARYTAEWGARADYVLPSRYNISVKQSGVFWPVQSDPLYRLVENREASSDHRLVWVDVILN